MTIVLVPTLCRALLAGGGPGVPWHDEVCALPRARLPRPGAGRGASSIPAPEKISILMFAPLANLLQLQLKQNNSVLKESSENKDDTCDHPALYRRQTLSLKTFVL